MCDMTQAGGSHGGTQKRRKTTKHDKKNRESQKIQKSETGCNYNNVIVEIKTRHREMGNIFSSKVSHLKGQVCNILRFLRKTCIIKWLDVELQHSSRESVTSRF